MSLSWTAGQVGEWRSMRMPSRVQPELYLYLVLDDLHNGYSIRQLSLPSSGESAEQSLPPPFMRIAMQDGLPKYITSAFGSKIMMIPLNRRQPIAVADILDYYITSSTGLQSRVCPIFIPVRNNILFVLDCYSFEICPLLSFPSPLIFEAMSPPPFNRRHVSSYAVQPDEAAILVSTKTYDSAETFIFDLKQCVWKSHGNWVLPFTDFGHYDPSLKAFVGLSKDPETLGYLYSCSVTRTDDNNELGSSPTIKRSKETVYSKNPAEHHENATLCMCRGKFCLVECVSIDSMDGQGPGRYTHRLMTFSLRYDMEGDLELEHCQFSHYILPKEATVPHIRGGPHVFWI
ncbi:unnamed protein product [Urochloa humidicola]